MSALREHALASFGDDARRALNLRPDRFLASVARRLELGGTRYGDRYLEPGWDGQREALEELEDAVAYLALAVERADRRGELDWRLVTRCSQAALAAIAAAAILERGAQ